MDEEGQGGSVSGSAVDGKMERALLGYLGWVGERVGSMWGVSLEEKKEGEEEDEYSAEIEVNEIDVHAKCN